MAKFSKTGSWAIDAEPEHFSGKIYYDGNLVWECGHKHADSSDARLCARRKLKNLQGKE